MKPIDVIREVKLKANGQWQAILSHLGAEVPQIRTQLRPALWW